MTFHHERTIRRALISVSDKTRLTDQARALYDRGIELVSTGGTRQALENAGMNVRDVTSLTGFPEILDGRVKTLHPGVHGGLLADRHNPSHVKTMEEQGLEPVDLLIVNLYPFEATVKKGASDKECLENIDIGGPAMIRAAAKNHTCVVVCLEAEDVDLVLETMETSGGRVPHHVRRHLAGKAFARTAAYDTAIAHWFKEQSEQEDPAPWSTLGGPLLLPLRYGENPHQKAGFYKTSEQRPGVASARKVQGKSLSYNNIHDIDAAYELVAEFGTEKPAVVIVKHANPCAVAQGESLHEAYEKALTCDPVSAFGGIIAVNQSLNAEAAQAMTQIFTEAIIAPAADEAALDILARKKNLRLLLAGGLPHPHQTGLMAKTVAGGLLVQSRDCAHIHPGDLSIVTRRKPTETELSDMLFAWKVAKHVKSNAIVYAQYGVTAGIGAGQMSRVDSARLAFEKAKFAAEQAGWPHPKTQGSACASDAFFPFPDGLLKAAEAGATAIIQPGGSIRDEDVIKAADEAGLAMAFTGLRHFRH